MPIHGIRNRFWTLLLRSIACKFIGGRTGGTGAGTGAGAGGIYCGCTGIITGFGGGTGT